MKKLLPFPVIYLLLALSLVGCGSGATFSAPTPTGAQALGGPPVSDQSGGGYSPGGQQSPVSPPSQGDLSTPAFGPQDCPQSSPISKKPDIPEAAAFPAGAWYANAEGSLWAGTPSSGVRQGENLFAWVKPGGSPLQISGQRLDIMAAPLAAPLPPENGESYLTATLDFPTDGCWQISAQAGSVSLGFILYVAP